MVGLGWYLDVIGSDSHVLVWVFGDIGEKSQKEENWESGQNGPLCRSEGCLAPMRLRAKKATPRVRCSVALLRYSESSATLRRIHCS